MKQIIPALIAGIFIALGGVGGFYLKSSGSAEASSAAASEHGEKADAHEEKSSDHGEKKDDGHGKDKKAKSGHGEKSASGGSDVSYYNFTREFVVPIIRDEQVVSLVILNLNLEVDTSISGKLFSMEPKLRDNIMTTLIQISNDGQTFNNMTNVDNYEHIRASVLANLQEKVATEIRNVLIMDMARQDV